MRACSRRTPAPADGCSRSVSSWTSVGCGVWSDFELCPALYIGTVSGIATPLYPAPTGGGLPPPRTPVVSRSDGRRGDGQCDICIRA